MAWRVTVLKGFRDTVKRYEPPSSATVWVVLLVGLLVADWYSNIRARVLYREQSEQQLGEKMQLFEQVLHLQADLAEARGAARAHEQLALEARASCSR